MINVTGLKNRLKQGIINPIYLFSGEEKYLINMYIKKVTDMALGDAPGDFNYSFYNEDNESYESFLNDVESYPIMSDKKVIVLKNTKFVKLKEYQKPLASLLDSIPDYAVVIIVEDEAGKIKKALTDVINKKGEIVEFKKQSSADLRAWVSRRLAQNGKNISTNDAEYLVNLCERSLEKLSVECDKLSSSAQDETVTRKLIEELVKVPVEYKIFEMSDKLLAGDSENAYKILRGFRISKVQPVVVFSVIYGQFGDLLMFRMLRDENKSAAEFLAPNRKWLAGRLSSDCMKYSKSKLRRGMKLCAEYDLEVKKGNIDGYTALELMMAEILCMK